ncbi:hypothetical protein ABT404_27210 [Streptomyces hyaluromycini]|uniref:Uncharacterized protein n=1 Tax=Streptomyces hyaluromycini TaxID=1377993 RepID=A0ABV1X262_9ACTN
MNRFRREDGWRSGKGRSQGSSNVRAGDNNVIQSIGAGGDVNDVRQDVSERPKDAAVDEVRSTLAEFRVELERIGPNPRDASDPVGAGLRAVDRLDQALGSPVEHRIAIESAVDTIGLVGRSIDTLGGLATAVHHAVSALWP